MLQYLFWVLPGLLFIFKLRFPLPGSAGSSYLPQAAALIHQVAQYAPLPQYFPPGFHGGAHSSSRFSEGFWRPEMSMRIWMIIRVLRHEDIRGPINFDQEISIVWWNLSYSYTLSLWGFPIIFGIIGLSLRTFSHQLFLLHQFHHWYGLSIFKHSCLSQPFIWQPVSTPVTSTSTWFQGRSQFIVSGSPSWGRGVPLNWSLEPHLDILPAPTRLLDINLKEGLSLEMALKNQTEFFLTHCGVFRPS